MSLVRSAKHAHIKLCDYWAKDMANGKMSDWWMSNRAAGLPVPNKRRTIKQPKPRRIADLAVADGVSWSGKARCLFLLAGVVAVGE